MKKIFSLIKTCLKDNMSIFKFKTNTGQGGKYLPWLLALALMGSFYANCELIMEPLIPLHLEYVVITLFILGTTILTIMEGIYKSSGLLFNCKDDSLLLTLPIKKSTVFFIRILKFYVFELVFNTLFLLPAFVCYAVHVHPGIGYYLISLISLFILPIIPIVMSTIIGVIISYFSSKFKKKRIVQTLISFIFIGLVILLSLRTDKLIEDLAKNAKTINDMITGLYYPAGLYINMITDFKMTDLILFLAINLVPFIVLIAALKNTYFKINSNLKIVKLTGGHNRNQDFKVVSSSKAKSFIKKEVKRLVNTPVYIINSCFSLFLYLAVIALMIVKLDVVESMLSVEGQGSLFNIGSFVPLALLGLIIIMSLMSSLTCCMVSLEGKSINILKSLPIKPIEIIMYKVYTVLVVEVPIMIIGVIACAIRFKLNIVVTIMLILSGFLFPLISGIFGIIVNIKFPKLDAKDDTEVVKQSISSLIAVMGGMLFSTLFVALMVKLNNIGLGQTMIVSIITLIGIIVSGILYLYATKVSSKEFNKLIV